MTESRDDGRYEVPIERLAGLGAGARRARVVAIGASAVIATAVGLAVLPGLSPPPTPPVGTPQLAVQPSVSSAPTSNRVETLVALPDSAIPGAPRPILIERVGDNAQIVRWTTGQGLAVVASVPQAFLGLPNGAGYPVLSPTSDRLFILSTGDDPSAGDRGRLVDSSGTVLWEGDGLIALSGVVWSADGRVVVAAAIDRTWRVITIDGASSATARTVTLPADAFPGSASRADQASPPAVAPRTVPLGFSPDGRWIYGAVISPQLASLSAEFRVATAGDRTELVKSFNVGRPDGLAPVPGTLGGRIVDPMSGSIADWRTNSDFTGGPASIEVRNADGTFAFVVHAGTPLGSAWDADGGLYVLVADTAVFPDMTSLVRVGAAGAVGRPIFQTGPVAGTNLVGVQSGFAVLGVVVGRPVSATQLVLVDLSDPGRSAAVRLTAAADGEFITASLLP
ncbi:MAG TPA: hypothetical protein VIL81_02365 [Candidatus Limnocylindrales bacterium]